MRVVHSVVNLVVMKGERSVGSWVCGSVERTVGCWVVLKAFRWVALKAEWKAVSRAARSDERWVGQKAGSWADMKAVALAALKDLQWAA
jgi:hypothetical protein